MAMPWAAKVSIESSLQPGRVLDAVDAGRGEVAQGLLAEAVRGDADALLVGGGDGVGDGLPATSSGRGRRRRGRSSRRRA